MGIIKNSRENFGAEITTEIEEELPKPDSFKENQERSKSVIGSLKILIGISIFFQALNVAFPFFRQFVILQNCFH